MTHLCSELKRKDLLSKFLAFSCACTHASTKLFRVLDDIAGYR